MKNYSVKIEGRNVIYKGAVAGTVPVKLSIWQRIKLLFGARIVITFQVFTKEYATPVGQLAFSTVTYKSTKKQHENSTAKTVSDGSR